MAVVFVMCVVIASISTLLLLADHDGNPTALLRVGEQSASRSAVEEDFDDVVLVPGYGHDGQQFYVIAQRFPDLQSADGHVDRLLYRARRVVLPAAVAPLPDGAPKVWGMLAVNLVAIGAAGVALSVLAARLRVTPWLGVAVAISPALILGARATLADPLALGLVLWGVVLWRRHLWWAVLLFAVAALTRETSLVVPLACAIAAKENRQRVALIVPFVVYGAWVVATRLLLDPSDAGSTNPIADATRQLGLPFDAWVRLGWSSDSAIYGLTLLVGSVFAVLVLWDRLREVALWLVFDAVLLVTAAVGVAEDALNLTRLAPIAVPAVALAIACTVSPRLGQQSRSASTGTAPADPGG